MRNVTNEIKRILDDGGVAYEMFEHEPVITSRDAARIRDTDISMGAKALVFLADKTPIIVVIPGDKKLDTKKFKKLFGIKDLSMADSDQLKQLTGLTKGAVPPLGKVFGIKTYYDEIFKQKDKVAFNAGSHTISVVMNALDLIKVQDPIFGSFIDWYK